jgi:hypothetical protein
MPGWGDRPHLSPIIVIPCSTKLQIVEGALSLSLVALVGGTRPVVSTAMVSSYLFECFEITALDVR